MSQLIPLEQNNDTSGFFWDENGKLGLYVHGVKIADAEKDGLGIRIIPALTITAALANDLDLSAGVTLPENLIRPAAVTIAAADIVATGAGKLGHADGYPIIAAPGAGKAVEFLGGVIINDFGVAAYTDGGDLTFNYAAGGAVSAAVSAANSLGAAGDKVAHVAPAVPSDNQLLTNTGINLVAASAFTDPGTAVGVARIKAFYRVHTTGL